MESPKVYMRQKVTMTKQAAPCVQTAILQPSTSNMFIRPRLTMLPHECFEVKEDDVQGHGKLLVAAVRLVAFLALVVVFWSRCFSVALFVLAALFWRFRV